MNRQEKDIAWAKKDIAKRLRWSNKILWESLSEDERNLIVDKYYHSSDIENIGIHQALEANRNISRQLILLLVGTMFGVLAGIFANIIQKYFPQSFSFDIFFVIVFITCTVFLFRSINQLSSDRLREDRALEYFVNLIRSGNMENANIKPHENTNTFA